MTPTLKNRLIHVGLYHKGRKSYLYLREDDPCSFSWYQENGESTGLHGPNIEEALRLAHKEWAPYSFRTLHCGFRYTLPERDEHGTNALFHQMIASYRSPQGIYFDDELGNNCFIDKASQEALDLWKKLEAEDKLG